MLYKDLQTLVLFYIFILFQIDTQVALPLLW